MDNINKFILELNTEDTDKVLKEYLPTNFHSSHFKNKTISGENKIIILIKSVLLCIAYFSKFFLQILFKKKQKIKSKYKLLVYVPNLKFERYYLSLFNKKESLDNLVISDTILNIPSINPNIVLDSNFKYFSEVFLKSFILCLNITLKNKTNYESLIHLFSSVKQCNYLNYFSTKTEFKKIFSLHPNGDLHFLLRYKFKNEIHSIRPTTTTYSEEHKYIKTDFLYYKSSSELKVYSSYNLESKFIQSGVLFKEIKKPKTKFNNKLKILFVDTVTNSNINSSITRRNGITDFYKCFSEIKNIIEVHHKFHPGLIKDEKNKTINLIKPLDFVTVEENQNLSNFDVVIGFFSTLCYDALTNGILFIELKGMYNLNPDLINSLHDSPSPKILDFNSMLRFRNIISTDLQNLYDPNIWIHFYKKYNIPNGKNDLLENLKK